MDEDRLSLLIRDEPLHSLNHKKSGKGVIASSAPSKSLTLLSTSGISDVSGGLTNGFMGVPSTFKAVFTAVGNDVATSYLYKLQQLSILLIRFNKVVLFPCIAYSSMYLRYYVC